MKKFSNSRYEHGRKLLIFWCLFIGIGAVAGATGMLTAPDGSNLGMGEMLPYFQVLPFAEVFFQNFIFPGIALLFVNGIPNLISAWLLLKRKKAGIICGGIFGVTLMAWIVIQFVILPPNFMSTSYFIFGLIQAITGLATWIFYKQEHFIVREEDYPEIGSDRSQLVIYFSRMGYTKRVAFEEAQRTGAILYEIKASERTEGTLGFWWCGRYGMHGWDMPIEEIEIDLSHFDHITICSPIWVFQLAGPVKSFLRQARGKIQAVDYIFVHFNPWSYKDEVKKADELLGISAGKAVSICSQWGKIKKRIQIR